MSRITDFEHCKAKHSAWLKKDLGFPKLDGEITDGRQELLNAIANSEDGKILAEYLEQKLSLTRILTSGLPVLRFPRGLSWEAIETPAGKATIADSWRKADPSPGNWLASEPVYWAAVHYQAIVEQDQTGNIREYFSKTRQQSDVEASNTALNLLGSAPIRYGYYAPMVQCTLGRIWWEIQTASKAASEPEIYLSESEIYEIIQIYPAVYTQTTRMSVSNLTTLNSPRLLAAIFAAIGLIEKGTDDRGPAAVLASGDLVRKWIREIGRKFYGKIPEYMDWDQLVQHVVKALQKAS